MTKKISELTAGTTPDGTELLEAVQAGASVSLTAQQIADLAPGAGLGSTVTALSIASGVVNVDCSLGDYFTLALTANVTSLTFSNVPASGNGRTLSMTITQDATGSRTFALPAAFKAITGSDTAIQSAANAVTKLAIETVNAGTTWAYVMKARA